MTDKRYPLPPVRPKPTPGKGVPMRQWAAPSYDPATGRPHSSIETQNAPGAGVHGNPRAQSPDGGFHRLDAERTQNPVPVRDRNY